MATMTHPRAVRRLVLASCAFLATGAALLSPLGASPAAATSTATTIAGAATPDDARRLVLSQPEITAAAVRVARRQKGDPYQYGAAGPDAFDCSGLVQFSFARAGQSMPRTSSEQATATRRVSAASARRGDLVFFYDKGGVYHVGIYLGDQRVLHSPRTGEVVQAEQIWTTKVFFGRVR